jgi:isochorismate synthase
MGLSKIIQENEMAIWLKFPDKFGGEIVELLWNEGNHVIPFDSVPRILSEDKFCTEEQYEDLVANAVKEIESGQIRKIVTSRKFDVGYSLQQWEAQIVRWQAQFPEAFVFCFNHPKWGLWMGATPELLLYSHDGEVQTMALAGSKKIDDPSSWTTKELQEHQVVVDMIQNTLHQSGVENIIVSGRKDEPYKNVKHLMTEMKGTYSGSWNQLINALHPTPALCGWPKSKAQNWLSQNEGYHRDLYGGVLNIFVNDQAWAIVLLRCCQWQSNKTLGYVGGGVMQESLPQSEWLETEWKRQAFIFAGDAHFQ